MRYKMPIKGYMVGDGLGSVNGFGAWQSRIHRMLFRSVTVAGLVLLGAFVLIGCGVRDASGGSAGDGLTAELVVPPASQVVVEAATAVPTATQVPTATVAVVEEVAEEVVEKQARVNVPNRGYNSLGDADAPITMFEFSDFL